MELPTGFKVGGCILVAILLGLAFSFDVVSPTEVGYVTTLGQMSSDKKESGLVMHLPFISYVSKIDTKIIKVEQEGGSASKDLQSVTYKTAVAFHINKDEARDLITTLGSNDQILDKVVYPAINETQKAITSSYNAEEVITKRAELKTKIDEDLKIRLEKFGLVLDEVSIIDIDFSVEYNTAIEQKQVAQQNALKAEYQKQQAIIDADKKIIEAKAQAETQRLTQQSLTKELLQKMYIEKWNGILPTTNAGGVDFLMTIN